MKTITAAVIATIAAAVIIFSVVTCVKGLISSVQDAQARAIAAVEGTDEKGGSQ